MIATATDTASMTVVRIESENIKNLRAVALDLDGTSLITGKNGAGKSALLDSILMGLTNTGLENPIRKGADRAEIKITLRGEEVTLIARRVYKAGSAPRLELSSADGRLFKSPQSMLDVLIGNLAFDPLHFSRLKRDEQTEVMLKAAGVDFSSLDKEYDEKYTERRDNNRQLKTAEAQRDGVVVPDDAPETEVSQDAYVAQLAMLNSQYRSRLGWETRKIAHEEKQAERRRSIADLHNRIAALEELEEKATEQWAAVEVPPEVDQAKIDAAEKAAKEAAQANAKYRIREQREAHNARCALLKEKSDTITFRLQAIEAEKASMLAAAPFPVPGIGVDKIAGVTLNGTPLVDLSSAERIKISTAIAMAQNPRLRTIFVRDGGLLDSDGIRAITEMATDRGYQVLIEKVQESAGPVGIHIHDGSVVSVNGKEV